VRRATERVHQAGLLLVLAAAGGLFGCWLVKSNDALDGPSGDAGAPDGGGTDGGATDARVISCGIGNLLCEDFEHGPSLASFWVPYMYPSTSTATIDTTMMAAHGKGSLHVHADPLSPALNGPPYAFIEVAQGTATPLPPSFFARFFVYAKSAGLMQTRPEVSALALFFEQTTQMDALEFRAAGPAMAKTFGLANSVDNVLPLSATPFPFDAWHCMEWGITATGMQVWLDGTALTDLTVQSMVKPVVAEDFGWQIEAQNMFTSTVGQEVWIDEIVLSTTQIGCNVFEEP
jgi:hypothetical protein